MRRNWLTLVTMVAISFATIGGRADDQPKKDAPQPSDAAAMEKLMVEFAKLAPQHEHFKHLVGSWNTESKSLWGSTDGKPVITKGKATFRVMMGGRYLMQRTKSEMNGEVFEGLGITGFDKVKKKYVGIWIDNMGTGIMPFEGEFNEKTREMVEVGEAASPFGVMKMKMVTKHVNDDKFIFSMSITMANGAEMPGVTITYTRDKETKPKKKAP